MAGNDEELNLVLAISDMAAEAESVSASGDDQAEEETTDSVEEEEDEVLILWTPTGGEAEEDAILRVGDTRISVNKVYLALQSPFFQRMFYGDFRQSGPEFHVFGDIDEEEFTEMLRVVLPCHNPIDESTVVSLLELADKFMIDSLRRGCLSFLCTAAARNIPTIVLILIAFKYECVELKERCRAKLFSRDSIMALSHSVLFRELSMEARAFLFNRMIQLEKATGTIQVSVSSKRGPKVYFDIGKGRILMELFTDVAPTIAEEFRALCTGERATDEKPLHYKGKQINCVVPGDRISGEEVEGHSFEREEFVERHSGEGVISMGWHTDGASFFSIFLRHAPHFDGERVVFGRVVQGMDVVKRINAAPQEHFEPVTPIIIEDCGQLE